MPPVPVVKVQPSFEHSYKKPKIAKLVRRKRDAISCQSFSKSESEQYNPQIKRKTLMSIISSL